MVTVALVAETETFDDQDAACNAAAVFVPAGGADSAPEDWAATRAPAMTTPRLTVAMATFRVPDIRRPMTLPLNRDERRRRPTATSIGPDGTGPDRRRS